MYSRALPTDTSSPIFSEGRGRPYTGYRERIIPSSNCPSKLTDKVKHWVESCKYRTLRSHYTQQTTREEVERETTRKDFLVFITVHKNASARDLIFRTMNKFFHT